MPAAFFQFQILSEPCAGDNAVDMGMEIQFLSPGVEDLDDTGSGAEESRVLRALQQGMCGTCVQQGIEKLLIGIDQRIQLSGECKDHMEVRGVNDLCFPSVDPDFLEDSLAVRAVAVPAGVVVDGDMSAVLAGGDGASHRGGLTVQDGRGSPLLHRRWGESLQIALPSQIKDLLYLRSKHLNHLPAGQKG